jgi:hypothetical protein
VGVISKLGVPVLAQLSNAAPRIEFSVVPAQAFSIGASAAEPAWQLQLDGWGGATHLQLAADQNQSGVSAAAILPKYAPFRHLTQTAGSSENVNPLLTGF